MHSTFQSEQTAAKASKQETEARTKTTQLSFCGSKAAMVPRNPKAAPAEPIPAAILAAFGIFCFSNIAAENPINPAALPPMIEYCCTNGGLEGKLDHADSTACLRVAIGAFRGS